jgi:hypothetical protein
MDVLDTSVLVLIILAIGFWLGHSSGFEQGKVAGKKSGRIDAMKELLTAQLFNNNKVLDETYSSIPNYADAIQKIRA